MNVVLIQILDQVQMRQLLANLTVRKLEAQRA